MPHSTSARPLLSMVVLVDRYETIEPVLECLLMQDRAEQIEVVAVAESAEAFGLPDAAPRKLGAIRIVEHPRTPMQSARTAGVRAARGNVVVLGETHAFPAPGWAHALLRAHEEPWASVTPAVGNANPESRLSWACLVFHYARWIEGMPAGEIEAVPGYNSSYKREALLAFGTELESLLLAGSTLHDRMRANGGRFYFEPAAKIDHLNVTHPRDFFAETFVAARFMAGSRQRDWSRLRRLVYVLGSPLLPVVFVARSFPALRIVRRQPNLPRGWLAAFLLVCIISAGGELFGHLTGAGKSESRLADYEEHRADYATAAA